MDNRDVPRPAETLWERLREHHAQPLRIHGNRATNEEAAARSLAHITDEAIEASHSLNEARQKILWELDALDKEEA